jgi:tRNA G18 (ribose-2'-O)-methylase SpoU
MVLLPARIAKLQRLVNHRLGGFRIVLDNIHDPGNRAAVFRSAEVFG